MWGFNIECGCEIEWIWGASFLFAALSRAKLQTWERWCLCQFNIMFNVKFGGKFAYCIQVRTGEFSKHVSGVADLVCQVAALGYLAWPGLTSPGRRCAWLTESDAQLFCSSQHVEWQFVVNGSVTTQRNSTRLYQLCHTMRDCSAFEWLWDEVSFLQQWLP